MKNHSKINEDRRSLLLSDLFNFLDFEKIFLMIFHFDLTVFRDHKR
jgi:hypothetical protein